MKILLKIAYQGTAYCGYQVQPNGITVQECLNKAALAVFGYDCDIVGCSRTDSGVHARAFSATVSKKGQGSLETAIPADRIPRALNAHLPPDIAVLSALAVADDFHARYDVISKEYEYLIYNGPERDPFLKDRVWHIPTPISNVALEAMQQAAAAFVGEKDFTALRDGDADEHAVRHVFSASVTRTGDMISFRVRADGFLYHMVRVMTGTLMDVARGRIPAGEIAARIESRNRQLMGSTAPAAGLYLDRVFYKDF
ncbi:MAG: tRNA pseudouridine(38-40) synthase TruA [Ruminococcaceae bacterium]|nr:tRNA pseudouridine(38-40) synthase TruA [Oscillospiraceae bacterium]